MNKVLSKILELLQIYRNDLIIVGLLLLVSGLPRLLDLGLFLTADEKNWIGRSYEFVRAFKDFRFNDMMQTTHPGVTTMWISGMAVSLKILKDHIPYSFNNLFHFIKAAQLPIALVNTLLIPVIYVFLRKLFTHKKYIAIFGSFFIALNPFLIGYSRLVHVDALLAGLLLISVLATILYVKNQYSQKWLITSAVFTSLALLTKAPAVFMLPFFVLSIFVAEPKSIFIREKLKLRLKDFVTWLLIAGLLFLILWPAMLWVANPEGNVLLLKRDIGRAAITPHHMAQDYTIEGSHYLFTLLSRTSPSILVLSAVGLIGVIMLAKNLLKHKSWKNFVESDDVLALLLLIAYIFFFVLMMTLGAKKGDRYILPVFLAIDILAAVGIGFIAVWLNRLRKEFVIGVIGVTVILILGVSVLRYHPYTLSYSNPVFADNLSQELGWGEGLEQVGKWLNENDPDAVVASWYPQELGVFTSAQVAHINAHEQGKVRYVVLYRNMFGRAPDHPANDFIDEYFKKRKPVYIAKIVGKEFAWVFEKPVYEQVVGEMTDGLVVGQSIPIENNDLVGIDILVATYSGKAKSGSLEIKMREKLNGKILNKWSVPVSEVEDDRWFTLTLPEKMNVKGKTYFFEFSATGTKKGDAPTLRYTRSSNYRGSKMLLSKSGLLSLKDEKEGDIAIRLRFEKDGQLVTEDDSKLVD